MDYEFSKESHESLKLFFQAVRNKQNLTSVNEQLNEIFPKNDKLIEQLLPSNQGLNDQEMRIIAPKSITHSPDKSVEVKMQGILEEDDQSLIDNEDDHWLCYLTEIENCLALDENSCNKQIKLLVDKMQQKHFIKVIETIDSTHLTSLANAIIQCDEKVIQLFYDTVLINMINDDPQGASKIFLSFEERYPELISPPTVKYLLNQGKHKGVASCFLDAIQSISVDDLNNMLQLYISNITQLKESEVNILNSLLHSNMDPLMIKKILDKLTYSALNLSNSREFGALLINFCEKISNQPIILTHLEQIKNLSESTQLGHRVKLQKFVATISQKFSNTFLSQTVYF